MPSPPERPDLTEIARELFPSRTSWSKDPVLYGTYEPYLAPLRDRPVTILELGVYEGESTKIFSRYFERGTIVAVDMILRDIDFGGFPNVTYVEANQTDGPRIAEIIRRHAPNGIDVVIDDASHVGWFSQLTFYHCFPHLVRGGYYIVEDWGTCFRAGWPDSGPYQRFDIVPIGQEIPVRIPSFDYGMMGFVKWVVDLLGSPYVGGSGIVPAFGPNPLEFVHLFGSTCVIKKWPT